MVALEAGAALEAAGAALVGDGEGLAAGEAEGLEAGGAVAAAALAVEEAASAGGAGAKRLWLWCSWLVGCSVLQFTITCAGLQEQRLSSGVEASRRAVKCSSMAAAAAACGTPGWCTVYLYVKGWQLLLASRIAGHMTGLHCTVVVALGFCCGEPIHAGSLGHPQSNVSR